jgi:uncharacterized membrane protein
MGTSTKAARGSSHPQESDLPVHGLPRSSSALWQVLTAAVAGAVVATVVTVATPVDPAYGALLGWVVGVVVYLVWVWTTSWRLDAEGTAAAAEREDPSRPITDVILLVAAVVSLAAVVLAIADASKASGTGQLLRVLLGIASIVVSWFLVHTLFTTRYAREYFFDEDGGIDFNMERAPVWSDFAYLAFTIGMTFQVSDTDLQTSTLRRIALRHMLVSYLFGAVIVAVTINLIAGLTR